MVRNEAHDRAIANSISSVRAPFSPPSVERRQTAIRPSARVFMAACEIRLRACLLAQSLFIGLDASAARRAVSHRLPQDHLTAMFSAPSSIFTAATPQFPSVLPCKFSNAARSPLRYASYAPSARAVVHLTNSWQRACRENVCMNAQGSTVFTDPVMDQRHCPLVL